MGFKTWLSDLFAVDAPLVDPAAPVREEPLREAYGTTVDADDDQWRRLSGDTLRDLSPMTQLRMQKMAHYLWEQNLLANRLIELPLAYLLAEGVALTSEDKDNQKTLDRFWTDAINDMDVKLPKKVRELALFGEQCYPCFVNEIDGMVRIGYLDPALIATVVMDPDNPEQQIGVVTMKNKKGEARRYRIVINGPEDVFTQRTQAIRATFTDGDCFYFRINDLSSGRRGRSDLLAQSDWLDAYDEFMFGELDRYSQLRAFIWDVTLKGATPEQVEERAKKITTPKPGSVRVHNDGEEWKAEAPSLQAADTSDGARLFRNHVLGGATMPETWFGGGGNVNRATAGEMNEPTFKVYTMRQRVWKHILESIGRYVLMQEAMKGNGGRSPDWSDPKFKVTAVFPELSVRDTSKYPAALQQTIVACALAMDRGLLTRETSLRLITVVAERMGVEIDVETELGAAQAELEKQQGQDTLTTPADDGSDPASSLTPDPNTINTPPQPEEQ